MPNEKDRYISDWKGTKIERVQLPIIHLGINFYDTLNEARSVTVSH